MADMSAYRARARAPLCAPYKAYTLCGMPPPSSGPLAVIQMLEILSHTPIARLAPTSLEAVHYFSEAGKLAFADRDIYLADPDFSDVPVKGLLDECSLALRAGHSKTDTTLGQAPGGPRRGFTAG